MLRLTAGAASAKRNQYIHLTRYLSDLYPDHESYRQLPELHPSHQRSRSPSLPPVLAKWVENCESLRVWTSEFTPAQATKIQLDGVRACVTVAATGEART